MAATSSKTSKVFSYIRRGDPFWFNAKTNIIHFRFSSENRFVVVFAEASKKSIPQKWSKKPKPPDANISIFGGGGGGWSFFCPFKNKSKWLVYAIYVKICKNGQRFRYSRYNWKYQPHLVHFILIFMNTLGKVSTIIYCLISCTVHALFRMVSVVLVGKLIWMNRIFFSVSDHFSERWTNCVWCAICIHIKLRQTETAHICTRTSKNAHTYTYQGRIVVLAP